MGAHYDSLQVKGSSREAVIAAAGDFVRLHTKTRLLVGPEINGWIALYLNEPETAKAIAPELAKTLSCTVLDLMVYHSDIFFYHFYEKDRLIDEYSSDPDHFEKVSAVEHEKLRGKPGVFRSLLGSEQKIAELGALLAANDDEKYLFEENRLEQFAKLCGIENTLTSYEYLTRGEWDGIKGRSQFIHIPDLTAEKAAKRAATAALRARIKQLKKEGLLCFESLEPRQRGHHVAESVFDPLDGGIIFRWGGQPKPGLYSARPPWSSEPELTAIPVSTREPYKLIFSKTGKWFAYFDGHLRLWNWHERKLVEEIKICSSPLQFNSEETLLLCQNGSRFEILEIQGKKICQVASAGAPYPVFFAWHPRGKFVVTRHAQEQLGLIDLDAGKLAKVLYFGKIQDHSNLMSYFSGTLKGAGISELQMTEWKRAFIRGSEGPFKVEFSPDGKFMFCATTGGLRVLKWEKVLLSEKTTPVPLFLASAFPPEPPGQTGENYHKNYAYDLAFDEEANRLLFTGLEGAVRFFNMNDSSTGILLRPPGNDSICNLQLSPNREFISCACIPHHRENYNARRRIQIWNYRLLRAAAGLDQLPL